ncbi:HEAT repeat domain-containing protein [Micromonospora sp. DT201]|uniref:HEAT repeat domain-containing protein n=1 Tax=Micromonospora sp. DT201 TaxID=3393442 RepID=UPI003CF4C7B5
MSDPAPPTGWEWLEVAVLSGDVLTPGSDARRHIFDFVRAERDGLMTRRLLSFITDRRAPVRRTILELLDQLSGHNSNWPLVADATGQTLSDVDPRVRRTAATLLVRTAEPDRVIAALNASTDPVVRITLADAMPWHKVPQRHAILQRLQSDPVPAIRLLANIAVLSNDASAAWPALDAVIRADLVACAGVLDAPGFRLRETAGQRWARALTDLDREEDCCAWAEQLMSSGERPEVRLEGVRMAVVAMRKWRHAPARVTPMLTSLLREEASGVRTAALRALAASLAASRLASDRNSVQRPASLRSAPRFCAAFDDVPCCLAGECAQVTLVRSRWLASPCLPRKVWLRVSLWPPVQASSSGSV